MAEFEVLLSNSRSNGVSASSDGYNKDIPIVVASASFFAHVEKLCVFTKDLVKRGHPVIFLTGSSFKDFVEATGATFEPLDGPPGMFDNEEMAEYLSIEDPIMRNLFHVKTAFLKRIPGFHRTLQKVLQRIRTDHGPDAPLVLLKDLTFDGDWPVFLGAPGLRPHIISIGHVPVSVSICSLSSAIMLILLGCERRHLSIPIRQAARHQQELEADPP